MEKMDPNLGRTRILRRELVTEADLGSTWFRSCTFTFIVTFFVTIKSNMKAPELCSKPSASRDLLWGEVLRLRLPPT